MGKQTEGKGKEEVKELGGRVEGSGGEWRRRDTWEEGEQEWEEEKE